MNVADLSTALVYAAIAAYTVAMIAFSVDLSGLALARSEAKPRRAAAIGMSTTWLAAGLHLLALVTRGIAAGRAPWANMFEFTLMFTFFMVAIFLGLNLRRDIRFIGSAVTLLVVLGLGVAVSVLFVTAVGVEPILDSYWLLIHVSVATLSTGLFSVAAVFAGLQLIQHRVERTRDGHTPAAVVTLRSKRADDAARRRQERAARVVGHPEGAAVMTGMTDTVPAAADSRVRATATLVEDAPTAVIAAAAGTADTADTADTVGAVDTTGAGAGRPGEAVGPAALGADAAGPSGPLARLMGSLPSASTLESWCYRLSAIGFVTWTFTLVAGAIWAEHAWGRPWGWDPKETWTFVIWVIYAAYLHARATVGWTAEKFAYFALAGFLALLANYYIVNIFIPGNHSYSGL
ncbi:MULTISPECIES: c-type cytochrome biogenesis protein CcsB [unclassified Pseudactinotalea]|uniref:c-type cytochrome biogenesis protein CcsB n=1 Tax=unclassified Pseudactinotalea TaxID=2649176 RepID=UPI001883A5ED|nr:MULTISPECIES: c-type cytochrome biogenesis protein CcsB [unclassified Pseudactinotalea]